MPKRTTLPRAIDPVPGFLLIAARNFSCTVRHDRLPAFFCYPPPCQTSNAQATAYPGRSAAPAGCSMVPRAMARVAMGRRPRQDGSRATSISSASASLPGAPWSPRRASTTSPGSITPSPRPPPPHRRGPGNADGRARRRGSPPSILRRCESMKTASATSTAIAAAVLLRQHEVPPARSWHRRGDGEALRPQSRMSSAGSSIMNMPTTPSIPRRRPSSTPFLKKKYAHHPEPQRQMDHRLLEPDLRQLR